MIEYGTQNIDRASVLRIAPCSQTKPILQDESPQRSDPPHFLLQIHPSARRTIYVGNNAYIHSKARILSNPMWSIAACISSRAIERVLLPMFTVTTNLVESGNTSSDSYHAGPLVDQP